MFDHVVFGTSDHAASKAFFLKALEPIGMAVVPEGTLGIGPSADGRSSLCIRRIEEQPSHLQLTFVAGNLGQLDAFHRAALEAGGKDNGAPGLRPDYSGKYHAAFVIGPDGHNIEVVCHEAETWHPDPAGATAPPPGGHHAHGVPGTHPGVRGQRLPASSRRPGRVGRRQTPDRPMEEIK